MKNSQTTILGLILGAIVTLFGALQPYITAGGHTDWKVAIPAVVIAVVLYLEKQSGSWKTTTVYAILAALGAGASTMIDNPAWSWFVVIAASITALAGAITKDHAADALPNSTDADAKMTNAPPPRSLGHS